ncbi:MAG TPA: hypothetical protein V6C81_18990 [Planktothrix sp.]|jgi:hypothetical protein
MNTKKYKICGDLKAFMTEEELYGEEFDFKPTYLKKPTATAVIEAIVESRPAPVCCGKAEKLATSAA